MFEFCVVICLILLSVISCFRIVFISVGGVFIWWLSCFSLCVWLFFRVVWICMSVVISDIFFVCLGYWLFGLVVVVFVCGWIDVGRLLGLGWRVVLWWWLGCYVWGVWWRWWFGSRGLLVSRWCLVFRVLRKLFSFCCFFGWLCLWWLCRVCRVGWRLDSCRLWWGCWICLLWCLLSWFLCCCWLCLFLLGWLVCWGWRYWLGCFRFWLGCCVVVWVGCSFCSWRFCFGFVWWCRGCLGCWLLFFWLLFWWLGWWWFVSCLVVFWVVLVVEWDVGWCWLVWNGWCCFVLVCCWGWCCLGCWLLGWLGWLFCWFVLWSCVGVIRFVVVGF